ncbi:MAG: DUF1289 domain-containing protein [Alphaproteobacteria bacterium]|nr:DUF1289 domain-containing protein [Alphaproteobacteria bacterium]MCW5741542.1 DUF1289 domain-containing protein [Alphaproteobacteria bacterium]
MTLAVRKRIVSPCIAICTIDAASGLCRGCKRTAAEVGRWISMSEEERERVIAELPSRPDPAPIVN